jgi:hypothetical protein
MIAAQNYRTIRDVEQSGDKNFEVVKKRLYLGSLMTPLNNVSVEIQRRIQTANRLQSSHLSCQTKFTIKMLNGSETWVLTKRKENQLLVFERIFLRPENQKWCLQEEVQPRTR